MKTKTLVRAIIVLGFLGLIISLYLLNDHYAPSEDFCTMEENSCSELDQYSEIFGIPLSLFGAFWFLALIFITLQSFRRRQFGRLIGWNTLGIVFAVYLIGIEISVQAFCPFCTMVHVIIGMGLVLSLVLRKKSLIPSS